MRLGIILDFLSVGKHGCNYGKSGPYCGPSSYIQLVLLFCVLHKTEEGGYIGNKAQFFPELQERNWDIEQMEQKRMANSYDFFCLAGIFLLPKETWRCDCINAESFCLSCTFLGANVLYLVYWIMFIPIGCLGRFIWTFLILISIYKDSVLIIWGSNGWQVTDCV